MMRNGLRINANGSKIWYLNDQYHRTDGPAIEYADGTKSWYLNGQYHRTDGPAIELANGNKFWYLNDQLHRTDGPAVEWADGSKEWFLNGQELSLNRWLEANAELSGQQRVMFKLEWA
jgi:hypothetical protein